jgi:hypothetical protein
MCATGFCFGQDVDCPKLVLFGATIQQESESTEPGPLQAPGAPAMSEDARIQLPASEAFEKWRSMHDYSDAITAKPAPKAGTQSTRIAKKNGPFYKNGKFWGVLAKSAIMGASGAGGGYLISKGGDERIGGGGVLILCSYFTFLTIIGNPFD